MQITRDVSVAAGPGDWFAGAVQMQPIAAPDGDWRIGATRVTFAPGARTAWHTHPCGQVIFVTDGVGRCQRRGGPVEEIRPGDRVFFEPGEDHWHGASESAAMTHLAVHQADGDGNVAAWGEHVADEDPA